MSSELLEGLADRVKAIVDAAVSVDDITVKSALNALDIDISLAADAEFRAKLREHLLSCVEQRMARESEGSDARASAVDSDSDSDSDSTSDDSTSSSQNSSPGSMSDTSEGGHRGDATRARPKRPGPRAGVFAREMVLSASLAAFFGTPRLPRGEAAKRLWAYVRESSLPKNPRGQYLCDDKLSAALGGRKTLDFKTAAKALAAGMKDPRDLVGGGEDSESGTTATGKRRRPGGKSDSGEHHASPTSASASDAAKRPRNSSSECEGKSSGGARGVHRTSEPKSEAADETSAKDTEPDTDSGKATGKRKGGFAREVPVSEAMATFLGCGRGSRSGAVSAIWAHVKAAGLQKPEDKRIIQLDERLKPLFPAGIKTVTMFSMVSGHIIARVFMRTGLRST